MRHRSKQCSGAKAFLAATLALVAPCACGGQTIVTLGEGPDATGSGGSTGSDSSGIELDLIDDMEDGDERVAFRSGRSGRWNTYNDGSTDATQWPRALGFFVMSPISPPRGSSLSAARTYGEGFRAPPSGGWATLTMTFLVPNAGSGGASDASPALPPDLYDASSYKGVTFFARVEKDTESTVRMNIPSVHTVPEGGYCQNCYDSFGKTLVLTTEWKQFAIPFAEMGQRGFGDVAPFFDTTHVLALDFGFQGPARFDFWIDDISFYR